MATRKNATTARKPRKNKKPPKPKKPDTPRGPRGRFLKGAKPPPGWNRKRVGISLTTILRRVLAAHADPDDPEGELLADQVVGALVKECRAGNVSAIKETLDRIDGKVPDVIVSDASFLNALSDDDLDKMIEDGKGDK